MSKIKISDMTRQLCDSAQELLQNVSRQQQAWRTRAQNIKRTEAAMQKAAEEAAAMRAAAQEAQADEADVQEKLEQEAAQAQETIRTQQETEPVHQEPTQAAQETVENEEEPQEQSQTPIETMQTQEPREKTRSTAKKPQTQPLPEQERQDAHKDAQDITQSEQTEPNDETAAAQQTQTQEIQRPQDAQGDSVNEQKNELEQAKEQQEAAPRQKVMDFRTKESRERSKPQQNRVTGPVYISKPDPSKAQSAPRDRDGAPAQRSQGRPMPSQGGQRPAGGAPRSDAPRSGGFSAQRSAGGAPRSGGAPARRGGGSGIASAIAPTQEKRSGSNYDPNKSQYAKKNDQEKKGLNRRAQRRMTGESMNYGEEDGFRGRKKKNKSKVAARVEPTRVDHAIMATERISVKDLSEKIGRPASEIIKKLFLLGIMATINNEIDFDTALLVCDEFGVELEQKLEKTAEEVMLDDAAETADDEENLTERPPVVTIMGHVDHGKTSLLDRIRRAHVTATEAGGITQHIGAYTVTLNGRKITFLDTPGHEAFTAMRARGAQATDIAVLVVAADDGIMPQTIEAINHAKAAGVSVIVAVNKIDRPAANVDRVMQQLTEYGLVPEEWGGDTIVVPVSAHTGENIDRLLEMILLVADVLELRANPARRANGIIIEARLDKGRGPVATVLVKNGTLRVGDTIVAGTAYGRVRAMQDDKGVRVEEAGPSDPVEVIGFSDVPEAGDNLYAVEEGSFSRQVAQERRDRQKAEQLKAMSKVSLDDLFSQIEQGSIKELNVIVKADVQGSVEAVRSSLEKISNAEVRVRAIHGGVGAITPTDVMLASASNAIIVGFNVRPQPQAKEAAETEKVDIRLYRIIYQAIEDIENAIHGMLAPVFREVVLGHVDVREVYRVSKVGTIAGGYVTDGKVTRNAKVRLVRDGIVVHEGEIASLRRFKDDVREVAHSYECGIGLVNYNDIKVGDQMEAFVNEQVEN